MAFKSVVWLIIFLLFCLWVVITSVLMLHGGEFFGIDLKTVLPTISAEIGNSSMVYVHPPNVGAAGVGLAGGITSQGETTQQLWIIAAHVSFFFTIFCEPFPLAPKHTSGLLCIEA